MRLLGSAAFAAILLACAAALMVWHVRAWRAQRKRALEPDEREFFRRQFRRRLQTSTLLAVVAASLPLGQWLVQMAGDLSDVDWPKRTFVLWLSVLIVLLVWIAVLAFADLLSSRMFFGRLRQRNWLEKTRLEAELRRIRASSAEKPPIGGNGKAPGNPRHKGPETKGGPEP